MPGWRKDFPSYRSTSLSHTLTHFSILVIDWRGCVGIGMVPQCLPLSPCAMKLIVAIEITDSHRNLDIFRGFAMMIRLYLKWDTPLSLSLSLSLHFLWLLSSLLFCVFYSSLVLTLLSLSWTLSESLPIFSPSISPFVSLYAYSSDYPSRQPLFMWL